MFTAWVQSFGTVLPADSSAADRTARSYCGHIVKITFDWNTNLVSSEWVWLFILSSDWSFWSLNFKLWNSNWCFTELMVRHNGAPWHPITTDRPSYSSLSYNPSPFCILFTSFWCLALVRELSNQQPIASITRLVTWPRTSEWCSFGYQRNGLSSGYGLRSTEVATLRLL